MKTPLRIRKTGVLIAVSAILWQAPGCQDVLAMNLLAGAREGLVTTVTGVIEDAFNLAFGLEEGGDEEESGDDLFITL